MYGVLEAPYKYVHYQQPVERWPIAREWIAEDRYYWIEAQERARFDGQLAEYRRQGMPIGGGGTVTSGTHSPVLEVGIGMGYVPSALASPGTELVVDARGKPKQGHVVKKPIYVKEES